MVLSEVRAEADKTVFISETKRVLCGVGAEAEEIAEHRTYNIKYFIFYFLFYYYYYLLHKHGDTAFAAVIKKLLMKEVRKNFVNTVSPNNMYVSVTFT
jgi:hypothetical protein